MGDGWGMDGGWGDGDRISNLKRVPAFGPWKDSLSGGGSWVILCGPSRASRGVILTVGLGAASGRVDHTTQYATSDAYYQQSSRSHVYMGLGRVLSGIALLLSSMHTYYSSRVCMLEYAC